MKRKSRSGGRAPLREEELVLHLEADALERISLFFVDAPPEPLRALDKAILICAARPQKRKRAEPPTELTRSEPAHVPPIHLGQTAVVQAATDGHHAEHDAPLHLPILLLHVTHGQLRQHLVRNRNGNGLCTIGEVVGGGLTLACGTRRPPVHQAERKEQRDTHSDHHSQTRTSDPPLSESSTPVIGIDAIDLRGQPLLDPAVSELWWNARKARPEVAAEEERLLLAHHEVLLRNEWHEEIRLEFHHLMPHRNGSNEVLKLLRRIARNHGFGHNQKTPVLRPALSAPLCFVVLVNRADSCHATHRVVDEVGHVRPLLRQPMHGQEQQEQDACDTDAGTCQIHVVHETPSLLM